MATMTRCPRCSRATKTRTITRRGRCDQCITEVVSGQAKGWDEFMSGVKDAAVFGSVVNRCSIKPGDRVEHLGRIRTVRDSYAAPRCIDTWVLVYADGDEMHNFSMAGFFYPVVLA